MRARAEYDAVAALLAEGWNDCRISRETGIPRSTIKGWRVQGPPGVRRRRRSGDDCPRCQDRPLDGPAYAYLLGLYLGDGCLSRNGAGRAGFRLRIVLDQRYPMIVFEAALAISMIGHPRGHVFMIGRPGCVELAAAWAHWPCLFPQHGPGPKHERPIELAPWQERIVEAHPDRLLRGLIQSDGCRCVNRVRRELSDGPRWYAYPRYMFSNNSEGIRRIFCRACDRYGVRWRRMKWNAISIARKEDVAHLDLAVGPKA